MPAVHVALFVEKMHGAAEPKRATGRFAKELGHAGISACSARESVAVIAIGGDDVIVITDRGHGADDDRLLADIKMTEASDLLRLILLAGAFLETADQQHEREHLDFVALLGTLHEKLCDA